MTRDFELASELRSQGLGWKRLSRATGIPASTLRRHLDQNYAEKSRAACRAYKNRQRGTCVDCGAETTLRKQGDMPSPRCHTCAVIHSRRFDHDHIVRLRTENGLSQAEIANRVGCAQAHVSNVLCAAGLGVGRGTGPGRGPKLIAST